MLQPRQGWMDQCQWNELLQVKRFISSNVLLWPQLFLLEGTVIPYFVQLSWKDIVWQLSFLLQNPDYEKNLVKLSYLTQKLNHNPDTGFCFDFHFCQAFLMSFLALISKAMKLHSFANIFYSLFDSVFICLMG